MAEKRVAQRSLSGADERISEVVAFGLCLVADDFTVLRWNGWLADHSGIQAEKAVGRSLLDLFPELEAGRFGTSLKSTVWPPICHAR